MLNVTTLRGTASTASAYLSENSKVERYYAGEEQKDLDKGVYFGGKSLGLDGQTVGKEFTNILDGRDTEGKKLYTNGHEGRRLGFDLTLSPDKTISLLWARCNEENRRRLENVVHEAAKDTLTYIQNAVLNDCVRRGKGGVRREKPKELTWALFQHGASRELDPQLHIHAVLINCVQRHDGSYGAIAEKALFERQGELRKVFDLALSSRFATDFRILLDPSKDGPKVGGVPKAVIEFFSKRRQKILAEGEKQQVSTADKNNKLNLITRPKKQKIENEHDRFPIWQKQMDEMGYTQSTAFQSLKRNQQKKELIQPPTPEVKKGFWNTILGTKPPAPPPKEMVHPLSLSLKTTKENHQKIRNKITDEVTPITETQLKAFVAESFMGQIYAHELASETQEFLAQNQIEQGKDSFGRTVYTTSEAKNLTKETDTIALQVSSRVPERASKKLVETVKSKYKSLGMSDEQLNSFEDICSHGDLKILIGAAGTGKSFTLKAVREVYEGSKLRVRGLAPTGKAAENLQESSCIESQTIHKFLRDLSLEKTTVSANDVFVIDESSMIGEKMFHTLLRTFEEKKAKVVLVGDHKQLSSVEKGTPFERLLRTHSHSIIKEVRRQKQAWQKEASQKIRDGQVSRGLTDYHKRGYMKHRSYWSSLKKDITDQWMKDRIESPSESQIILCTTNKRVDELNESIRKKLRSSNHIGEDVALFVKGNDGSDVQKPFAKNDQIYFTKNDRKLGINNGTVGKIESISSVSERYHLLEVSFGKGKRVKFNTGDYNHITHGYAATVHKSQGDTVDRSYVVLEKGVQNELLYVAMTRHRESCRLYCASELVSNLQKEYKVEIESQKQAQIHIENICKNVSKPSQNHSVSTPETSSPAEEYEKRASEVQAKWDSLSLEPPNGVNRYLERKHIEAYGVRFDGENLVIPMRDMDGKIWSLQIIRPEPDALKIYEKGALKSGHFHLIGEIDRSKKAPFLFICEGYATGATLHKSGYPVAVAFDVGNLDLVTTRLKEKYPGVDIYIMADNDRHRADNIGYRKALDVAKKHNVGLGVPLFRGDRGTNYNDLMNYEGNDALKSSVSVTFRQSMEHSRNWALDLYFKQIENRVSRTRTQEPEIGM